MSLNVSTNIMDYFQGNTNKVEDNGNKSEFSRLFEMSQDSLEDINSELDSYVKDSDGNIDYELLQGLLSGLATFNINDDLTNISSMSNKVEPEINDLIDILNNVSTKNQNEQLYNGEVLNTSTVQKDKEISSLENFTYDYENEALNTKTILTDIEIDNLENLFDNYSEDILNTKNVSLNKEINELNNLSKDEYDTSIDNQINNIIDAVEIEVSYNELEVNSLSNKSNLINDTKTELEDDNLLNNMLGFNNIVTEIKDSQSNVNIESSPIRELRQEVIGDDIVQTVKYMNENGLEEIKVKITPRELGEMTIKIMKSLEETKLSITINNEETYNLLNKNVNEISNHLKALDINLKDVSVDIISSNENLFSENFNQQFNRSNQNNGKQKKNKLQNFETENIDDVTNLEIEDNNLNILI